MVHPNLVACLERHAALHHRIVRDLGGDGSCQFRSLSDQLFNDAERHSQLRNDAVTYLSNNSNFFAPFVNDMRWEEYIEKMREPHTWGDHLTLLAVAEVHRLRINILRPSPYFLNETTSTQNPPTTTVWLGFYPEIHYVSLPQNEITADDLSTTLQQISLENQDLFNAINARKFIDTWLKDLRLHRLDVSPLGGSGVPAVLSLALVGSLEFAGRFQERLPIERNPTLWNDFFSQASCCCRRGLGVFTVSRGAVPGGFSVDIKSYPWKEESISAFLLLDNTCCSQVADVLCRDDWSALAAPRSCIGNIKEHATNILGNLNSLRESMNNENNRPKVLLDKLNQLVDIVASSKASIDGLRSTLRIAVLGVSGAGKSTLLNSILGKRILPSSPGNSSVTGVKIAIRYATDYKATCHLLSPEWLKETAERLALPSKESEESEECEEEDDPDEDRFGSLDLSEDPDPDRRNIRFSEVQQYLEKHSGGLTVSGNLDDITKSLRNWNKVSFTDEGIPLEAVMESISVQGPFSGLESGIELVDLPGVFDDNPIRSSVAWDNLRTCDLILLVHNVIRGGLDKLAEVAMKAGQKSEGFAGKIILVTTYVDGYSEEIVSNSSHFPGLEKQVSLSTMRDFLSRDMKIYIEGQGGKAKRKKKQTEAEVKEEAARKEHIQFLSSCPWVPVNAHALLLDQTDHTYVGNTLLLQMIDFSLEELRSRATTAYEDLFDISHQLKDQLSAITVVRDWNSEARRHIQRTLQDLLPDTECVLSADELVNLVALLPLQTSPSTIRAICRNRGYSVSYDLEEAIVDLVVTFAKQKLVEATRSYQTQKLSITTKVEEALETFVKTNNLTPSARFSTMTRATMLSLEIYDLITEFERLSLRGGLKDFVKAQMRDCYHPIFNLSGKGVTGKRLTGLRQQAAVAVRNLCDLLNLKLRNFVNSLHQKRNEISATTHLQIHQQTTLDPLVVQSGVLDLVSRVCRVRILPSQGEFSEELKALPLFVLLQQNKMAVSALELLALQFPDVAFFARLDPSLIHDEFVIYRFGEAREKTFFIQHLKTELQNYCELYEEATFPQGNSSILQIGFDELQINPTPINQGGQATILSALWKGVEVGVKRFVVLEDQPIREMEFLFELDHPYILKPYGSVEMEATPATKSFGIVMPLLPATLEDRLYIQPPLQTSEVIRLSLQLSRALSYISEKKVLHRDVKPSNVLLTNKALELADLVLADFGAASKNLKSNTYHGTEFYSAPEVRNGEEKSPASDIYSFGIILYELLTGVPYRKEGSPKQEPQPVDCNQEERSKRRLLWDLVLGTTQPKQSDRSKISTVIDVLQQLQEKHRRRTDYVEQLVKWLLLRVQKSDTLYHFGFQKVTKVLRSSARIAEVQRYASQDLEHLDTTQLKALCSILNSVVYTQEDRNNWNRRLEGPGLGSNTPFCIYYWWNTVTGKGYVGKSDPRRFERDDQHLKGYKQVFDKELQGNRSGQWQVITICTYRNNLQMSRYENMFILLLDTFIQRHGYNVIAGGLTTVTE